MSYRFILVVLAILLLNGCVKVQLLPEDSVKNTFKAGKNLYDESKLKRQGGKKREHSSQVVVADYSSRDEAEIYCLNLLKSRLEVESTKKSAIVVSEKVIVVDGLQGKVIECQVKGYVWL